MQIASPWAKVEDLFRTEICVPKIPQHTDAGEIQMLSALLFPRQFGGEMGEI